MRHKISGDAKELDIVIDQLTGNSERVLEALRACAEGRCSCPSPQYAKLESIDIATGQDDIRVKLKARPEESIERADIERCLAHTVGQAR